jgi:methylthioribulose-1-phosphate dehydratase
VAKIGSKRRKRVDVSAVARTLQPVGRDFYARGWVLGTSGNFSVVVSREPLLLGITRSGVSKGDIRRDDVLIVDAAGRAVGRPAGRPSAEALLHVLLARTRGAGAVLHTHSASSTLLSEQHAAAGGVRIQGFEMLKGLEGVSTHEHAEWIPILDNDQDIARLAGRAESVLESNPAAHAFLLRGHGLYTWGANLDEARRHIEILEFLLDVCLRGATR